MKQLFIILVFSVLTFNCKPVQTIAEKEVNVLFIGNSLTYFHDMPQMVQSMVLETHPNIKIHQSTYPGMSLSAHLDNIITSQTDNGIHTRKKAENEITETEKKIKERQWDVVILQTGGVSILIPESRDLKVNKAIAAIKNLAANPNCKFILFNTWASKSEYPKKYCYPSRAIDKSIKKDQSCSPNIENLEQEIKLINSAYTILSEQNNVIKSSNGDKFYETLTKHPSVNLYEDDSHPNEKDSFLNACIFYELITNSRASTLKFTGTIEPETAQLIKDIAH